MAVHLKASPETCAWGYFDASLDPVFEVQPGETIVVATVSGGPDRIPSPSDWYDMPPEPLGVHDRSDPPIARHILTGPVPIVGATSGQVLEVRICDVQLGQNWGVESDPTLCRHIAGRVSRVAPVDLV